MEVRNPAEAAELNLAKELGVSQELCKVDADEENSSIIVSFDKHKIQVSDVIAQFMKKTEVKDIKIQETELSEIVKEIYNHGV